MIDLRSDTVTRPTPAMREAMASADVGDDVYGEDPSVNRLQELAADLLGFEAALFTPSGTQANLVALLTHCGRGDEYLVGHDAHTYRWEGGGAAVLGGIQPQPLPFAADGSIPLEQARAAIKPDDAHFARTRVLALENTQHGRALPLAYLSEARAFADAHGLALHLDGARLHNAALACAVAPREVAAPFHSVSVCLSKGLGAPVGSLLCGSRAFIDEAHRWRKVSGGGMRQAGVLAAAGLLALTDGAARLQEDHDHAALLAARLEDVPGLRLRTGWLQTNMVWADFAAEARAGLSAHARERGLLISPGPGTLRLTTHRDVGRAECERAAQIIAEFFRAQ